MTHALIRYKVKPDRAEDNEQLAPDRAHRFRAGSDEFQPEGGSQGT